MQENTPARKVSGLGGTLPLVVLLGFFPVTAHALTIRVPADQPTIQQGINAAHNGDTVLVSPGTYFERIDYHGKAISVQSIDGPTKTIIDGSNTGTVVNIQTHEGVGSILTGFTIQHGHGSYGGGAYLLDSAPTITNNIFRDNVLQTGGAAIYSSGLFLTGSSPVIEGNTFLTNSCDDSTLSGVIHVVNWSSPIIINNIIKNNPCRAINVYLNEYSNAVIANNTIVGNNGGLRMNLQAWTAPIPTCFNNILVANGVGLQVDYFAPLYLNWRYNLVFQNTVNYSGLPDLTGQSGNISVDPRLGLDGNSFPLLPGSPAIDAGTLSVPGLPLIDFLGQPRVVDGDGNGSALPDIGAYEFQAEPTPTPTLTPPPTPTPTPPATPTPAATATPLPVLVTLVSLPLVSIDSSVTDFTLPVRTSLINADDNLVSFQGDLTFDASVVSFQSEPVLNAGLTGNNWNVSGNVLPGTGPIRTLRISAFSNDSTPLSGSGCLFNLNLTRVSSTQGVSTVLTWAAPPDDFIFIDTDLNTHSPGGAPPGRITISPVGTISLPTAIIDSSVTTFSQPTITSAINAGGNFIGFQGDISFDSTVVTFQNPPVSAAGLTSENWNVSGNILPGPGPIRTLRISAFSNDFTPLSGSGDLFNLNMTRLSSIPGASTALTWAASPDDFIFIDADLNLYTPSNSPPGSITIQATSIHISGNISGSNPNLGPVPNVTLTLSGSAPGLAVTDGSGNYMSSFLVPGGSYVATPSKSALVPGSTGISTIDVVATQRHFLGLSFLTGWSLTAANVNGDNDVTTVDVIAIQRFYLGLPIGTAKVGMYQFTPANRSYTGVTSDQPEQNYATLIFGNVVTPIPRL